MGLNPNSVSSTPAHTASPGVARPALLGGRWPLVGGAAREAQAVVACAERQDTARAVWLLVALGHCSAGSRESCTCPRRAGHGVVSPVSSCGVRAGIRALWLTLRSQQPPSLCPPPGPERRPPCWTEPARAPATPGPFHVWLPRFLLRLLCGPRCPFSQGPFPAGLPSWPCKSGSGPMMGHRASFLSPSTRQPVVGRVVCWCLEVVVGHGPAPARTPSARGHSHRAQAGRVPCARQAAVAG